MVKSKRALNWYHPNLIHKKWKPMMSWKSSSNIPGARWFDERAARVHNAGSERSDEEVAEMMTMIETNQEIRRRGPNGEPLVFCEQWAKAMVDMMRDEVRPKSKFELKLPWQ